MFFGRLLFKNNSLIGGAMNNRVYIFDTTLRDGEQSPGATMNLAGFHFFRNGFDSFKISLA